MKGIEISRAYYEEYGRHMIESEFSEFKDRIAVGLVGHGSECFGFDDDISRDHDFAPSFCLWLTDEDEKQIGFKLFRAYSKLPAEFNGIKASAKSLMGSNEFGVQKISEFYAKYTGRRGAPGCWQDWLYTPSHYLAEATNGEVFYDPLGEFTEIRNEILNGMPEDVRLKKIASCALHIAQSGQYNYKRCIAHEELAAARFALDEFARNAAEIVFLLERKHMPYYKWVFRAMHNLPRLSSLAQKLEDILLTPIDETLKIELDIESYCSEIVSELKLQGITEANCDYLETHAYSINDMITSSEIRNLNIIL